MYPQADLTILARRKQDLLTRISYRRETCAEQILALAHPFRWVGSVRRIWNAVSPFAKIAALPAGLMLGRKLFPGLLRWVRWAPAALKVYRAFYR
ncbi:MAG TPA: hypothetical protein VIM44_09055 [Rariglobus sp.]